MDEKRSTDTSVTGSGSGNTTAWPDAMNRHSIRRTRIVTAVVLVLWVALTAYFTHFNVSFSAPVLDPPLETIHDGDDQLPASAKSLVPLEAHIISKCPDTRVRTIIPPFSTDRHH